MEFLFGFLGALLAAMLFAAGAFAGWKAHIWDLKRTQTAQAKELTEQERQKLIAEQQAFNALQNYSAETAYGRNTSNHYGGDGA